jgi:hypothetical protein
MLGVMKLKFVTRPCWAFASVPAIRDGRFVDGLACSVDRIAAGKLQTPGEV